MKLRSAKVLKIVSLIILAMVLVGISAAAMPKVKVWLKPTPGEQYSSATKEGSAQLVDGEPNMFRLPTDVVKALGVRTAEVKKATQSRQLELPGSLAPDTDHLLPVRSRFPGEVMEVGQVADGETGLATKFRGVRNGDLVQKGQLLAVVWSKDLGLQKSQLVDALSKLRLDQETLKRLGEVYLKGAVPERSVREAERNVESDRIAESAAVRTLRSWRLTEKEIETIYAEAKRIHVRDTGKIELDKEQEKSWARVEVWAPFDGTILEKNISPGAIVDTTTNLFMISDLRRLTVVAYPYEEDLPALQTLPKPIHWTIHLKGDAKAVQGTVIEIRPLIDPTMHTGLVKGQVDNPEGQLFSGQFITVTIDLPPLPDEVVIPTTALIEDGQESIVFVQPDPKKPHYTLQRVAVARRSRDVIYVRSQLKGGQKAQGLMPLYPGQWVVTAGALEMKAALKELQDTAKTEKK